MVYRPGFKVFCRYAAKGKDTVRAASHAWRNNALRPNPNAVLQIDWECDEVEGGFFEVVVPTQQQSPLGNADVAAD